MPGSSYEILTRRFLFDVFGAIEWTERERPNILKYATGNNLELDLWAKEQCLAVEVQGPQHYRSVTGMATADQSQTQRDRDTFKRQRCVEEGIKLVELNIYTLAIESRFYSAYQEISYHLGCRPMTREQFQRRLEIQEIISQASLLARRSNPTKKRRRYRKPGLWPLIRRVFSTEPERGKGRRAT